MSRMPEDVLEEARRGDPIALTRALVSIPSVNPDLEEGGAAEREAAEWCAAVLEAWGYDVAVSEVAPRRATVLARLGSGERRLLLNGHLDTVGVEGMTVEPFEPRLEGSRLYGRGACDMKSGIAAILAAAARWADRPEPDGELMVALTADEEHASVGIQALLDADLVADAAVVCEPTSLAVAPANKGFTWFHLLFRGRAAHGSRPELGVDAIRHAGRFLVALDPLEESLEAGPAHPLLGHASLHAGTITGGSAPSVYPAECRLVLERRTLPGEGLAAVEVDVRAALEGAGAGVEGWNAEVRRGLTRPAAELDGSHPLVTGLLSAIEEEGRPARVEGMTAWVESAFLVEAGIPAVCFGPGSIEQAHTADEWVDVDEVEAAARILERFVRSFLEAGVEEAPDR